jgi:hypothetical protein
VNSAISVREKVSQESIIPLRQSTKMCVVSMTLLRVSVLVLWASSTKTLRIFRAYEFCKLGAGKLIRGILAAYVFLHTLVERFNEGTVLCSYLFYPPIDFHEEVFSRVKHGYFHRSLAA